MNFKNKITEHIWNKPAKFFRCLTRDEMLICTATYPSAWGIYNHVIEAVSPMRDNLTLAMATYTIKQPPTNKMDG